MNRAFITFSDGVFNDELTSVLESSISKFSKYPLIVYRKKDFEFDFEMDLDDPNFWSSGYGYVYKVISCLKALETYDSVVWLDTDCVVTNYIDKIWFEEYRIDRYPLLPKYRFNLFGKELTMNVVVDSTDEAFMFKGKQKIGVGNDFKRNFYSQACMMFFDKSCIHFYEEVLSYFKDFDSESFPCGDESIINCLLWRYGYLDNLGDVFLCSHYFGYGLGNFIENNNRELFDDFFSNKPISNIHENILFYHGTKDVDLARFITRKVSEKVVSFSIQYNAQDNKIYVCSSLDIKVKISISNKKELIYQTEVDIPAGLSVFLQTLEDLSESSFEVTIFSLEGRILTNKNFR